MLHGVPVMGKCTSSCLQLKVLFLLMNWHKRMGDGFQCYTFLTVFLVPFYLPCILHGKVHSLSHRMYCLRRPTWLFCVPLGDLWRWSYGGSVQLYPLMSCLSLLKVVLLLLLFTNYVIIGCFIAWRYFTLFNLLWVAISKALGKVEYKFNTQVRVANLTSQTNTKWFIKRPVGWFPLIRAVLLAAALGLRIANS